MYWRQMASRCSAPGKSRKKQASKRSLAILVHAAVGHAVGQVARCFPLGDDFGAGLAAFDGQGLSVRQGCHKPAEANAAAFISLFMSLVIVIQENSWCALAVLLITQAPHRKTARLGIVDIAEQLAAATVQVVIIGIGTV